MAFIIPDGTGLTMATPADGALLAKSGSTLVAATLSGETFVVLGADRPTSSTSYVDCAGLSFSAAANTNYLVNVAVIWQSTNTTCGIAFSWNGPSSPTNYVSNLRWGQNADIITPRHTRAYDTGSASASVAAANTDTIALGTVILRNGANAATFILRFHAEIGSETVTIYTGSALSYRVVA